jgi:hypothetical protein
LYKEFGEVADPNMRPPAKIQRLDKGKKFMKSDKEFKKPERKEIPLVIIRSTPKQNKAEKENEDLRKGEGKFIYRDGQGRVITYPKEEVIAMKERTLNDKSSYERLFE